MVRTVAVLKNNEFLVLGVLFANLSVLCFSQFLVTMSYVWNGANS